MLIIENTIKRKIANRARELDNQLRSIFEEYAEIAVICAKLNGEDLISALVELETEINELVESEFYSHRERATE